MSYSQNKYRHRDYRQRDRQYQHQMYHTKKRMHDRYHDHRYNNSNKGGYHGYDQQQLTHQPHAHRGRYNHKNGEYLRYNSSDPHSNSSQYYDHYHPSRRYHDEYSHFADEQSYDYNEYETVYSNGDDSNYSRSLSRVSYRRDDDYCFDEEDGESHYVSPISPLDLEHKERQMYVKKHSNLHSIYLYQSEEAKKSGLQKVNTLDIRAAEAKMVNNYNRYAMLTEGIEKCFQEQYQAPIHVLEIGRTNNLPIYRKHAKCIASYVGIDTADESRCGSDGIGGGFDVGYVCADIFTSKEIDIHPLMRKKTFDLINIDLSALHFAFKSRKHLSNFVEFLNTFSHAKTYMICSFVRDDVIMERFNSLCAKNSILNILSVAEDSTSDDNIVWQNRYQSMTIKRRDFDMLRNVYCTHMHRTMQSSHHGVVSLPYYYYQMHSVDNVKEYFICFEYLRQMLFQHCHMDLVSRYNATELYSKYSKKMCDLNGKMVPAPSTWTEDERQVIDTYAYALFRRQPMS